MRGEVAHLPLGGTPLGHVRRDAAIAAHQPRRREHRAPAEGPPMLLAVERDRQDAVAERLLAPDRVAQRQEVRPRRHAAPAAGADELGPVHRQRQGGPVQAGCGARRHPQHPVGARLPAELRAAVLVVDQQRLEPLALVVQADVEQNATAEAAADHQDRADRGGQQPEHQARRWQGPPGAVAGRHRERNRHGRPGGERHGGRHHHQELGARAGGPARLDRHRRVQHQQQDRDREHGEPEPHHATVAADQLGGPAAERRAAQSRKPGREQPERLRVARQQVVEQARPEGRRHAHHGDHAHMAQRLVGEHVALRPAQLGRGAARRIRADRGRVGAAGAGAERCDRRAPDQGSPHTGLPTTGLRSRVSDHGFRSRVSLAGLERGGHSGHPHREPPVHVCGP